jgi:hypothetical protein
MGSPNVVIDKDLEGDSVRMAEEVEDHAQIVGADPVPFLREDGDLEAIISTPDERMLTYFTWSGSTDWVGESGVGDWLGKERNEGRWLLLL